MDTNTRKTELSIEHRTAVILLCGRILDVPETSMETVLKYIFGKKITYGSLYDLSKEDFTVAREAFKEAQLTVPTVPLKTCLKMLGYVTPESPLCPSCRNFPISEEEVEKGMQTKGTCPICLKGQLIASEVQTEHVDWTNGTMVPITKTTNTTSVPGTVLYLTHQEISSHRNINLAVSNVISKYRLSLPQFLLYLREVKSRSNPRLSQPIACLKFLEDPQSFDIDSEGMLDLLGQEALQFSKRRSVTVQEKEPIRTNSGKMKIPPHLLRDNGLDWTQPKVQRLRNLLASAYDTHEEIRMFLADIGLNHADISFGSALNTWHSILTQANARGMVGDVLTGLFNDSGQIHYQQCVAEQVLKP